MRSICLVLFVIGLANCINVDDLIKNMDWEDKCGQMTQVTFQVIQQDNGNAREETPIDLEKLKRSIVGFKVGSILNTPYDIAASAKTWQDIITVIHDVSNETKLKIPILYGIDSNHGANYIQEAVLFPQPLSVAATFNKNHAKTIGEITAKETRAVGIPWNFSPVMDLCRQPAWPRIFEGFGEDPHVAAQMGANYVQGHQGTNLKDRTKAATCLKHYVGYSFPFNGRDRSVAWIPEILLREHFLPPFESALAAGSPTVMINSGDVNGLPGHANYQYLTEILKGELKLSGFTVSDWEDIVRLHTRDKIAETPEEAVRIAVMAGIDMSMVPYDHSFFNHCVSLTTKDEKFRNRVNDAVKRILTVKDNLGLFEERYPHKDDLKNIGTEESENVNLEIAREAVILAKNEKNTLPLDKSKKILVTGPSADLVKVLNSGWSYTWQGNREDLFQKFGRKKFTLLEAIQNRSTGTVEYSEGADFIDVVNLEETTNKAQNVDYIILAIGEDSYCETPGNINSLMISESQQKLSDALFETGKPVIVVYVGGRPRIITSIVERAHATIVAFLPGNRGAEAIADVIFGNTNPSGRMPLSYPIGPNAYIPYDHKPLESQPGWDAQFNSYNPLFPFGHGLSYTQFVYDNLKLDKTEVHAPDSVKVTFNVKNTGTRAGKEAVLVYLTDEYGSVSRPNKQLKAFTKVEFNASQVIIFSFDITEKDMSFINANNKRVVESVDSSYMLGHLNASFNLMVHAGSTETIPMVATTTTSNQPSIFNISSFRFFLMNALTLIIFLRF